MTLARTLQALRRRARGEDGFAVLIAIGVLAVTALLVSAVWLAVAGDAHLSQHDLDAKRAYYAARAGENRYLYNLNQSPSTYWQTCANDSQTTPTAVPGSTTGEQYSFKLIAANGSGSCIDGNTSTLIDNNTGSIQIEFTGYSGNPQVTRTVVANFREKSPFEFAWYTVYEQLDSIVNGGVNCASYYRNGNTNPSCPIVWKSGDVVNGPMYTQDQYLVPGSNAPTFGRSKADYIESMAPGTGPSAICVNNSCGGANIAGTAVWNAGTISPPSDNTFLSTDATNFGKTFSGTTTISLSGTTATVTSCPSSCNAQTSFDIRSFPVIYVSNASGCVPIQYTGFVSSYPTSGCTGDVYVSGSYTAPLTIGAANNIIINNNLTTTHDGSGNPTGAAALGLVANQFVRVMHGVNYTNGSCDSTSSNIPSQTFNNLSIDAAILAIKHSFLVDNYSCGSVLNTLTINGALAQYFRGAVGTSTPTGYTKNYRYDNRLKYLVPPYLFNVANAQWHLSRETLCTPASGDPNTTC